MIYRDSDMTAIGSVRPELRFSLLIWPRGDCWEWRGPRGKYGHGSFSWLKNSGASDLAYRHSYELAKGPLGPSLTVDHLCGHGWCVRPSHLEAVPQAENSRRCITRVLRERGHPNAKKTHCVHGHPYDAQNTLHRTARSPSGHQRYCRACRDARVRKLGR